MADDTYPGTKGRAAAIRAGAPDVKTLIMASMPYLLGKMTPRQIGLLQRAIDAEVINPQVKKDYQDRLRQAETLRVGNQVNYDEKKRNEAWRRYQQDIIPTTDDDRHVRLDFNQMLTGDALLPVTDNPDEAHYLGKVRNILTKTGVWINIEKKPFRDPASGGWRTSATSWTVWLSLGSGGDPIPSESGKLTRDALLDTTALGAGYYTEVSEGAIAKALGALLDRVSAKVSDGIDLHLQQMNARGSAGPVVTTVSDLLGGADYPDIVRLWEPPQNILKEATNFRVNGEYANAFNAGIAAAVTTQYCTKVLEAYINATTAGASRAVSALTVFKVAGEVAELFLLVRAVFGGLVRLLARGGGEAAKTGLAYQKTVYNGPAAHQPTINLSPAGTQPTHYAGRAAFEKTIGNSGTIVTDAGVSTALNRYDVATRQVLQGHHNHVMTEIMKKASAGWKTGYNADGTTFQYYQAPIKELINIIEEADRKWGNAWAIMG